MKTRQIQEKFSKWLRRELPDRWFLCGTLWGLSAAVSAFERGIHIALIIPALMSLFHFGIAVAVSRSHEMPNADYLKEGTQ